MTARILLLTATGLVACDGDKSIEPDEPGIALDARVLDAAGEPIADAHVLMGGWSEDRWVQTDEDGLACRGHIICLMSMDSHEKGMPKSPSGSLHVIDAVSKRHR